MKLASTILLIGAMTSAAYAQQASFERCAACHEGGGAAPVVGPKLTGVFGRKAGSRDDFRYSRALSRSEIVWDERNLDAFLKAPDQFMPGTRMPFEGVASDAERAEIIRYLKTLK